MGEDPTAMGKRRAAMIAVEQVGYRYRGAEEDALQSVDLRIADGSLFGLLGPNGAGKTTLLSLLTGVRELQGRGRIEIGGRNLSQERAAIQAECSLVPQEHAFYPMLTARENLAFFGGVRGLAGEELTERIEACLAFGSLAGVADRPAQTYSGGLKRRLNLAIGLLNRPRLLFLDEPTVGIDLQSRTFILDSIRALHRAGATIVYTSHYMEEVQQLCDEVAIIDGGRVLVQDTLDALLARTRTHELVVELVAPLAPDQRAQLGDRFGPRLTERQLRVPYDGDSAELAELCSALRATGARVARIAYGSRDLDRLVLELTRPELRD